MKQKIAWEDLMNKNKTGFSAMRANVFLGWIVHVYSSNNMPTCSIYIKDKEHEWVGTLEKGISGNIPYYNWEELKRDRNDKYGGQIYLHYLWLVDG